MKHLLIAVGLASQFLFCASNAECNCKWSEPEVLLKESTVVFSGIVRSATPHSKDPSEWPKQRTIEYTFQVAQVWKGPLREEFSVFTPGDRGCDSFDFEIGQHYIVYAKASEWRNDILTTNACKRPQLIDGALWDRVALGKAHVVNGYLAIPLPSEYELLARSQEQTPFVSGSAKRALEVMRSRKAEH